MQNKNIEDNNSFRLPSGGSLLPSRQCLWLWRLLESLRLRDSPRPVIGQLQIHRGSWLVESWRGDRRRTGPYQRGLSKAPVHTTRPEAALRLFMDRCFVSNFGEVRIEETGRKLGKNIWSWAVQRSVVIKSWGTPLNTHFCDCERVDVWLASLIVGMVRLSKLYTLIILTRKQLSSANVSQLNLSIYRFNNLHLMDTCISWTVSPSCSCEIQRNIEQTCQKSDIFVLLLSAANEQSR